MALEEAVSRANPVRPSRLALPACGLTLVLIFCAGGLAFLDGRMILDYASLALLAVANAAVGGVVATKRPANPVGWLFLATALFMALQEFARRWAVYGLTTEPGVLPFPSAAAWVAIWSGPLAAALTFVVLPLYFPDGRPVSPRWRPIARLVVVVLAANLLLYALVPGLDVDDTEITNPLGVEALRPHADAFANLNLAVWLGLFFVAVLGLGVRFRRSRGDERQQIKWFLYAVAAVLTWFCVNWPLERAMPHLFPVLDALVISGLPVAAGVAVLKYRLYDIDLVINRTLVYGALTACVVAVYVLAVGYLGAAFQTRDNLLVSLVATGLVAVLFQPLHERLQRGVNRLMYGERDDPYAVLSGLGQRLETALAPDAVLPALVETVREALKLPYAAVALEREGTSEIAASAGSPTKRLQRLPLTYQDEAVGELLLAPRSGEDDFSAADRRLFGDLARQAGVAVHAARLTADLQRSREQLVTAREEERRRMRRDLHDGLGAQLAGLNVQAGVLRKLIPRDPAAADALVVELREELRTAIGDIRRLVYDLRPPALDDLGLLAALERITERYGAEGDGLGVALEAPAELPPLPAAVEVAVYRIAQEALTNVVRHARAKKCAVRLAVSDGLRLEISDDGVGLPEAHNTGVGLLSMQERAAELGGTLVVEPSPGGGTRVIVDLPLTEG